MASDGSSDCGSDDVFVDPGRRSHRPARGIPGRPFTLPDDSLQKQFDCYTQEELEGLRFFMSTDENCKILSGSQTRTHYEMDAVCGEGEERMKMHVALEAADPTSYTAAIRYEVEGKPAATVNATGQWLQESCNISDVPIS